MRCVNEAALYEDNCFVTLTYNDANLPSDLSLVKDAVPKFVRAVRKDGHKLRYYACGEYGDEKGRPHYHALLFGYRPDDLQLWSVKGGQRIYVSDYLERKWKKGFVTVGEVTFESAAYVARYVMKKITGERAEENYEVCTEDGEVFEREPEFNLMSRRPGIGAAWFEKYRGDCYPSDFVVQRGMKMQPPRFYDEMYEREDADGFAQVKMARLRKQREAAAESTSGRLCQREVVTEAKVGQLKRSMEEAEI